MWERVSKALRPLVRLELQNWVALKEVCGLYFKTRCHCRHYGEILLTRHVMETESVPQHDVCVLDRAIPAQ